MPRSVRKTDVAANAIRRVLEEAYVPLHHRAQITVYRHDPISVRVRVLDPDFKDKSLPEREEMVWPAFESLSEKIFDDIGILLLLTPEERSSTPISMDFDNRFQSSSKHA